MVLNDFYEQCKKDSMRFFGRELKGKFKHLCLEWDFMEIDETTKEFECCMCYPKESNDVE